MTKKILFGMMATTMMFATSCENELDLGTNVGENAQVTFSVGTPEIATRAFSDGQTATVLQYAVYDASGNQLTELTVTDGEIHGSTTVNLQLTTGNTYSVIFWAAAENAPYDVDFDTKTMTVDYSNAVSNDENRDAFYKYHTFTVTGAQTETIELKRPFAQLNIGTNDYDKSANAGYAPAYSYVKVPVSSTLNLVDGTVNTAADVEFKLAAIPQGEEFPVEGYDYLSMNYLLVPADKEVVDLTFGYSENSTSVEKTRTVGSVPVQRNYRTNIYGQLFTSNVDINVEINPEYDEPAHEADALLLAAAVGGEVTLTEDVVLSEPLNVVAGMIINMDGKKLTGSINVAEGVSLAVNGGAIENTDEATSGIVSNGNLILNDVEISSARHALRIESGNVIINGGTYKVVPTSAKTVHALNVGDDNTEANVIIKGGTFIGPKGTIADSGAAVAVKTGSKVTIEGGDFSGGKNNTLSSKGTLTVTGGTYDQDPSAWVTTGNHAVEKDGKFYVTTEEVEVIASTAEELLEALNNGKGVALQNDIAVANSEVGSNGYGATGISQLNGGIIDGNGNNVSVDAWSTWDSAINTTGGTIRNVNVTGGMRGIFVNHNSTYSDKVILENVTIDGTIYTISCDQGTNKGLEAYNSTFNGWTSYAATIGAVKFDGCSFGEGQGYAFCRPYAATEFVNCNFAAGYEIDSRAAVTFENCTLNGEALTSANLSTLVTSNIANATVK